MTEEEEEKNKKNPWYKSNIKKTIKKRKNDQITLLNAIQTMDAHLITEISDLVAAATKKRFDKEEADWSLLDSQSDNYDKNLAGKVRDKIDEVYSLKSKHHPLAGILKKDQLEKLKGNYFNERLVQGLYFKHVEQLKKSIGVENYMMAMTQLQGKNLETIAKETEEHMASDINNEKHGDQLYDFLKTKYKFDEKKVDTDIIKYNIQEIMKNHIRGGLNKDQIHRQYKKIKKV